MIYRNWNNTFTSNFLLSSILPVLMVLYLLYLGATNGNFSLTGIDGEYVYLLNGLNVSALRFDNIGFTDHPGTPFLVLIGIFLRLSHLLFGQGNIIDDVIARPDFYVKACSMFMLGLSSLVLIWGGKKIFDKTKSITALLFIQGTYFLSEIVLAMQLRLIVDRLLPLVAFIFSVYTILYLFDKIPEKKYALISGIIMGFGFIAKFNFVVLALIPPLILHGRNCFRYGWSFILAAFISFLPVIDKFGNAKRFILQLFLHKGTYGGGERGILDVDKLVSTIDKLYNYGENFVCFFGLGIVSILMYLLFKKGRKENRKKVLFLAGFLISCVLIALMASKNFKNYYLIPTLGLSGIVAFLSVQLISYYFKFRNKAQTLISIVLLGFLVIPTIIDLNASKENTNEKKQARIETRNFIDKNIGPNNYWLLEPGWVSGPFEANGLLWGISYVAGKNSFTKNYMDLYPKILTFEGIDRPFKHFRTKDAEIDTIFNVDTPIYLFSSPGRRTKLLKQELINQSESLQLEVSLDTIFTNTKNNDQVMMATFQQIMDTVIYDTITTFNDMEKEYYGWKQNAITEELAFSGQKSTKILRGDKTSSIYRNDSIPQSIENLNSIGISGKYYQTGLKNNTRIVIELTSPNEERFWYSVYCIDYFNKLDSWGDLNYKMFVPKKFRIAQKLQIYFYNSSKYPVFIDDIKIELHQAII